ncbi:hypothetical protein GQ55_2G281900 [Panicum hallii var. hallii]|uniref:Alpha/beta hydrolase fold-3 domain-containing protein n=1 Tax=Panicum hallii var. hallii TaxID=1504633 RepID=A0A2T7ET74_9POAL|nr:hypothetical protein GQ55_2G281900 [Panicum hallii var. hallii]
MDPSTKLVFDPPLLRVYDDGRVERFYGTEATLPGSDAVTRVASKDVVVDSATGVFVRFYIPDHLLTAEHKKVPILVYFHGGGFVVGSAVSPAYHRYLNSVASKAGVLAVSVSYRLVLEHPLPTAYEDLWAASGAADPWLSDHGDTRHVFLAGDSGGANIVHNIAIMAGARGGLPSGVSLEGLILLHPVFSGEEPLDGESIETREMMEKLWALISPQSTEAPSLQNLACRKLLVCSAEGDYRARARATAYYQAVKESGWRGSMEWLESVGEEHVFFLHKPECEESLALMDRLVAFLGED